MKNNLIAKSMEIHYKCTCWCKIILPDDANKEEIVQKLNAGILPLEIAYDDPNMNVEWETITETEEFVSLEENDGQATIELMDSEEESSKLKCIWDNSFESELKRKQNDKN